MNAPNFVTEACQVKVPHRYFRKAKSDYSEWRWDRIREFIQNAYDAQSNSIDFRLGMTALTRPDVFNTVSTSLATLHKLDDVALVSSGHCRLQIQGNPTRAPIPLR